MTFSILLYVSAIAAGVIGAIIAVFAFLFHRREFWKIREWEQMRVAQKTLDATETAVREHQAERDRLTTQIADARATIDEAGICKEFLAHHATWQAEKEAIEKDLAGTQERVRKATEELVALQQRRDEIVRQVASMEDTLKRGKSLEENIPELERRLRDSEARAKDLDGKLAQLGEAEKKLQTTREEQQRALDALAQAQSDKKQVDVDVENLKKERDSTQSTLSNLKQLWDEIRKAKQGTVEIEASAFAGLYKPVFVSTGNPVAAAGEHDMLGALAKHIKAKEFHFPRRLLNAFHTALKTSDISCLTVMAGVSGTGKSALPKLYAEAMGFHFTLLAVEPRWDSPRDLFGFFNYMENRYEPTQLARALIQFDRHEATGARRAADNLSDQMLMILLDEMNLARIEYYFSEYLSKLELRHAIIDQIADAQSDGYLKTSMELFSGRPEKKENPIRLFAGRNVLFVGTMNEDETTQSLSDKVIDRANVIHFSRPLELKNRSTDAANHTPSPQDLSMAAWRSWQRPSDDTVEPLISYKRTLEDLNGMLNHIGRPFAYRTYQAIMAYVANYPYENEWNTALADQVAMRIMPKLRGLDLDQHRDSLNQMRRHIDGMDPALSAAFSSAIGANQGFFAWRGIDWG